VGGPISLLVEAGIYPDRGLLPENAKQSWADMHAGGVDRSDGEGQVSDWFRTFGKDELDEVWVTEEYHPVPVMGSLLAILTVDEADLASDDEHDDD